MPGPGCALCDRERVAKGKAICSGCEAEFSPTPLRAWRDAMDVTLVELREDTGLGEHTILRADRGERMSHDVAMILAKRTGLPWRTFRGRKE